LQRPVETGQYGSAAFATLCDRHGVRRSTGRTGSSYDNALAEAFFATLQRALDVDRHTCTCEADARRDVFGWIAFSNHRRRHSTLGHVSPADYKRTVESVTLQQIAAQPGDHIPGGSPDDGEHTGQQHGRAAQPDPSDPTGQRTPSSARSGWPAWAGRSVAGRPRQEARSTAATMIWTTSTAAWVAGDLTVSSAIVVLTPK
jgi:hypothetical protein